jgi:integrase
MATFRFRANRWQARVRRKGNPDLTKTFVNRQDAERWARSAEVDLDRGSYVNPVEAQRITLGGLIDRYIREVLPAMKGAKDDGIRLAAMKRNSVAKLSLANLTPEAIGKYRDERLRTVAAGTVVRNLAYISSVINHARREWGITVANPIPLVRKPTAPKGRDRLLSADELARLLRALEPTGRRNPWMQPLVQLALETAMRRGELLALRWSDIDLSGRTATLWQTKNGDKRVVPLSSRAIAVLQSMPRNIGGVVFPINGFTVSAAFERALERAGIRDFHFHDFRHMAVTELSKRLPNLIELAAVSGHRSLKMLQRYYHPNPAELAVKLG